MSSFYDNLAGKALDLLKRFGKPITIQRTVTGNYDPSSGVPETVTTFQPYGQVFAFQNREIDGYNIQAGDRRVLVAEKGLNGYVPNPTTDTVFIDGEAHAIVSVRRAVNEPIVLELQVRRS